MGSSESKIGQVPSEDLTQGSLPSTPILTPKIERIAELDPRSPSNNIARTPLQLSTPTNEKQQRETTIDSTPVLSKNNYILGIDPRSPTTDFSRTPIILPGQVDEEGKPKKLYNKVLENVRKSVPTITTPKKTESLEVKSSITPPKLLESSPITSKPDANKRKSFVGLLETNIDFTETDLDKVFREKTSTKSLNDVTENLKTSVESNIKNIINVVKNENADPRSPTTAFVRTPIQIVKKIGEIDLNDSVEVQNSNDDALNKNCECISPSHMDEIILNEMDENLAEQNKEVIEDQDEMVNLLNVEPMLQENMIIAPKPVEAVPEIKQKQPEKEILSPILPVINITADVKDFDKKLSNLIYEDDTVVMSPKINKTKGNHRAPLGNRNYSSEPKKTSLQKLKVSDKPRKSDYVVSKIPVFKDKKGDVQCENTPPRNMQRRQLKAKKSQWDNDNTLVI